MKSNLNVIVKSILSEALDGDEADVSEYDHLLYRVPKENVFNNYNYNYNHVMHWLHKSVQTHVGSYTRFIVCKPYNRQYMREQDWYSDMSHCAEYVRKFLKLKHFYITREIVASKVHLNILAFADRKGARFLDSKHDKKTNKYKYHVQTPKSIDELSLICDYMIKESKIRNMKKIKDIRHS